MSRYWSAVVRGLTPYVPGEQPKLPNLVKLNTNENPYGPSPKVLEALRGTTGDSSRLYPDPNADRLKAAGTRFVIEPHVRFKGLPGEQATMFFLDPSGNALEFKAFEDPSRLFAKQ